MMWLASRPDAQGCLPAAHEAAVWSAAWHPLGHVLASGGCGRGRAAGRARAGAAGDLAVCRLEATPYGNSETAARTADTSSHSAVCRAAATSLRQGARGSV